jgi:hypothetical protein
MAKEKAETPHPEPNALQISSEAERLEAIAKVRQAFEVLETYPDRLEANARRVKLLGLWNQLIRMRAADAEPFNDTSNAAKGIGEEEPSSAIEGEPQAFPELLHDVSIEDAPQDETLTQERVRQEEAPEPPPELPHAASVDVSSEEEAIQRKAIPPEDFIGPLQPAPFDPSRDIELDRVRLKLIKTGLLHDTVLPAGTIIAVIPVDAHHILESGMADYAGVD